VIAPNGVKFMLHRFAFSLVHKEAAIALREADSMRCDKVLRHA
jgi:hypothetical protein